MNELTPTAPTVFSFSGCAGNKVPTDCLCIETCETKALSTFVCPSACYPGCQCAEGYVQNASGDCIPATECPCYDDVTKSWNMVGKLEFLFLGNARLG